MMFKKSKKKIEQPLVRIFPITKSIRYNTSLDKEVIKRQIIQRMFNEILLSTKFTIENMNDGTTLMVGVLNTCVVDGEEEYDEEQD